MFGKRKKVPSQRLVWTGSLKDLVTTALFMGRMIGDADKAGKMLVATFEIDISPYKDFRSLREALEKECDVEAARQKVRQKNEEDLTVINLLTDAGLSLPNSKTDGEAGRLGDYLEFLNDSGISPKTMKEYQPVNKFATLPEKTGQRITWHASLADFTALTLLTASQELDSKEAAMDIFDRTGQRFLSFMDVDLGTFPDIRSMLIVYETSFDIDLIYKKVERISKASKRSFKPPVPNGVKPFTPYEVQSIFNTQVAQVFAERWPGADWEMFSCFLDALFIPDELIDEVLQEKK